MRTQWWQVALGVVAVAALGSGVARAEVVTEQSGSILVFPKVIADGTRDTIIQISNTSNSMVHAHCFYVNGALTFPDLPQGPQNPPLWTEVDFDIWLTKQQPTYWVVSSGRLVDSTDPPCTRSSSACPNAGIDPGRVPPVVPDFTGELKCIEVDASGAPLSGNHLKGVATLVTSDVCNPGTSTCELSGTACTTTANCTAGRTDVAKYNALSVIGNENNNGDGTLCLGGGVSDRCPNGGEYNACPQTWILDHFADGAENPVLGTGSSVTTDITVVPCEENFETQEPTSVTIQFAITNEFEQTFSASTTVTCWAELRLSTINDIFSRASVGSDLLQTRMRPSSGTGSGFMVVADERHESAVLEAATAAGNLHVDGERATTDAIVIPVDQLP